MPDYTKVFRSISSDVEFRALSGDAQLLYFWLLCSPTLNYAGICDWRPARLAHLWPAASPDVIETSGEELRRAHFVYPDTSTEEALVRSFVKHDKAVKQKNLGVTLARNYVGIVSDTLRSILLWELVKFREAEPAHPGWVSLEGVLSEPAIDPQVNPRVDPRVYPQILKIEGGVDPGVEGRATHNSQLTTHTGERVRTSSDGAEQPRPELEALCERLANAVEKNDFKRPATNATAIRAARLLLDADGYTIEQVEWMIDWATKDQFWYKNIRSMAKLRDKFDRLKAEVRDEKAKAANGGKMPSLPPAPRMSNVEDIQSPPEHLQTDAEISAWYAADRKRRGL